MTVTDAQRLPALVARLRTVLAGRDDVRLAVLFGSAATGRTHPASDVDVAVLPASASIDDELALNAGLTIAARAEVHLVHADSASTLLRWHIARDGIPIFERTPGELARFRARAAAEYIDFAPALSHHAETFRRRLIERGAAG